MTNRSNEPERRRTSRVSVDLWVEERTGDATYFQRATNLSPGGVFLHGTLPHPPGTRVALDLRFAGAAAAGDAVAVEGEVVVSTGARGMGIRFVELSAAARQRIEVACAKPARRRSTAAGRDRRVA